MTELTSNGYYYRCVQCLTSKPEQFALHKMTNKGESLIGLLKTCVMHCFLKSYVTFFGIACRERCYVILRKNPVTGSNVTETRKLIPFIVFPSSQSIKIFEL